MKTEIYIGTSAYFNVDKMSTPFERTLKLPFTLIYPSAHMEKYEALYSALPPEIVMDILDHIDEGELRDVTPNIDQTIEFEYEPDCKYEHLNEFEDISLIESEEEEEEEFDRDDYLPNCYDY